MRRFIAVLLLVGALLPDMARPAAAQEGNQPPPGGVTIHVVQRGENLFRIAQRYGTTVEAIAAANGIADPRYITVGQRLLIPNAQIDAPGAIISRAVAPGDTLETLAYAYHTTVARLADTNRITNPALLFVGQELTINQGEAEAAPTAPRALYRARPGDNVWRVALRYRVSLNDLLAANDLALPEPIFPGQRWRIPGGGDASALTDLPAPFESAALSPIPAIQGETLSIRVVTEGPATLTGQFMGYPVQIVTQDGNQHYALFGIHAFADAGVYSMTLTATTPDGAQTTFVMRVRADEGGYGTESISLDTQQQDLLTPQVTEPEWQRVATIMSGFTAQRYFDGLMGLPSTGAITSQFGTRRAYNGGTLDTFHSGTDFGGAPGSPITAPAAGVVVLAETLPVRGNATIIDHGWGVLTGYWHQSEIYVSVGEVVTAGQVIGAVGSTGRSTGPHLHWEMWVGGVQVDPMQWVQQRFP
jgi:murein DD-endopeptidase MepM/ murein hydrolase activator NlpD